MPIRLTIDPQEQPLTAIAEGEVTHLEFEAFLDAIWTPMPAPTALGFAWSH